MNVKLLIVSLLALLPAFSADSHAQQQKKTYRVSYLSPRPGIEARDEAFRQGLRDLGYVEGQNLTMDWRFTKGKNDIVPDLAAELLRLRPDCVIAVGVTAVRAFKQLTDTIPIIMPTINADPVEIGLIASLARPGGNITGFTGIGYDLAGKRLELIKEAVPKARRAAILVSGGVGSTGEAGQAHIRETEIAARFLKVQLQVLEVRKPEELD
jgi:putative ABC transport system substrate-binding protein